MARKALCCTHCGTEVHEDESVPGQVWHPQPFDYGMGRPDTAMLTHRQALRVARRYRRERGY